MPNRHLIEFGSHDGSSEITVRLSTGKGFRTGLSETPSRETYLPLIQDAGNINTFLFRNASTSGFSPVEMGRVVLNNADGSLDFLEDRGLGGFDIDIREETGTSYPSDFPVRVAGSIAYAEFSSLSTRLIISDRTFVFRSLQYQPHKYSGDNNGSSIELEGTDGDIIGKPKPILLGTAKNIPPVMVNEAKEIYQISSEPVDTIDQVYIGRATTTVVDTVHTSLTSFLADSVTAGQYNVYFGDYSAADGDNERGCYIMMGTTPSHALTVDATEGWKNLCLYSEGFSNGAWVKSNITVGADSVVAPDGNTTADTLTSTAANSTCLQTVTLSSAEHISGIWLKRKTGTGDIDITLDGGSTYETQTLTTAWQFFETTKQTLSNPQVGVRIVTSGDEVYAWGSMLCERDVCGAYVKTTSVALYNHHIPALLWKVLDKKGHVLDAESITVAQAQFAFDAQHWQDTGEILTGKIVDVLKDSALFYVTSDISGKFIVKRLELPTSGESVKTYTTDQLLGGKGRAKIKKIASSDKERGVPIHKSNVGYDENYLRMTKEQLTGVADTTDELAYVNNKFRFSTSVDNTVKTQFPNSQEKTIETKLTTKAGADQQAADEMTIFKERRPMIEIKVPEAFTTKADGSVIEKGDVITIESKHYRIIGQKIKFPSAKGKDVRAGATIYQAWGGS